MTAHTLLIIDGDENTRHTKALDLATEFLGGRLSKFDLLEISNEDTDKMSLGIEASRRIIDFLKEKPIERPAKGVIIHEAGNLTVEAQNALLKTLEEPPKTSFLILTSAKKTDLLPTILSRCQIIRINNSVTSSKQSEGGLALPSSRADALDWILENKETLEDKTTNLTFLLNLETSLRQEILAGNANPNSAEALWKTREAISKNNANPRLAIEEWLLKR